MSDRNEAQDAPISSVPARAERPRPRTVAITDIEGQLVLLERRLDDGYRRIEQAHSAGQETSAWDSFWIELLHQYESLADDLALAA
jgi:hypothetical protein